MVSQEDLSVWGCETGVLSLKCFLTYQGLTTWYRNARCRNPTASRARSFFTKIYTNEYDFAAHSTSFLRETEQSKRRWASPDFDQW